MSWQRRMLKVGGVVGGAVLLLLVMWHLRIGKYLQVREDVGDQRYCFLGVCYRYVPMGEPVRSKLLAVAALSNEVGPRWYTVYSYGPSEDNPDAPRMWAHDYWHACAWAGEDPDLGRIVLEDLAAKARGEPNDWFWIPLLTKSGPRRHEAPELLDDWAEWWEVRYYFEMKGYKLSRAASGKVELIPLEEPAQE